MLITYLLAGNYHYLLESISLGPTVTQKAPHHCIIRVMRTNMIVQSNKLVQFWSHMIMIVHSLCMVLVVNLMKAHLLANQKHLIALPLILMKKTLKLKV